MAVEESFRLFSTDWTVDPHTGKSNSSAEYLSLMEEVSRLIRNSAHSLMNGKPGADSVAALILSQLAHVHHLLPVELEAESESEIHGTFEIKGRRYTFVAHATPDV